MNYLNYPPPPPPPTPPELKARIRREQQNASLEAPQRAALEALIEKWRFQYRKRFADAQHEPTEFGRRFIEHGGWNIHNCMCELERALAGQAGQSTGDLPLQVVQQDAKSP